MEIWISFTCMLFPGVDRFLITGAGQRKQIPDIMRIRYYNNEVPYSSQDFHLPLLYDLIEYDFRLKEWFIVKEIN